MTIKRYTNLIALGTQFGTSRSHAIIKQASDAGILTNRSEVLKGFQRLDTLAGKYYGDSTLWWIIAAASGIGWGLQVPPGTVIIIPEATEVAQLLA